MLPYIFLVNTRENKDRLVGLGWINFLWDSLRGVGIFVPCARSNNVVPLEQVKYDVNKDICVISRYHQPDSVSQRPDDSTLGSKLHVPITDTPSSSKGCIETNHRPRQNGVPSKNREVLLGCQRMFIADRNKLLKDMLFYINDEKVYISLFLQLTHCERENCYEKETNPPYTLEDETVLEIVKKLLHKGSAENRAFQRQNVLQRLQTHQCEDDFYKEQLEYLINMEEDFLNDSA